jgi:hypothetical protein
LTDSDAKSSARIWYGAPGTTCTAGSTPVRWIVQNRNDVAIANRHPFEVRHPTFIGRPREVDLIGHHRKQHLPRTAEFAEAREDESHYFLKAQVGVKAKSEFAMPDVAERD